MFQRIQQYYAIGANKLCFSKDKKRLKRKGFKKKWDKKEKEKSEKEVYFMKVVC